MSNKVLTEGLNKQFIDQIIKPSTELATDGAEIFIDDILKNESLKEVPIIKQFWE